MISQTRMGEIALLLFKKKLRNDGLRIGPHVRRQAIGEAKDLGISPEEAMEFMEKLARELFEETFSKKL